MRLTLLLAAASAIVCICCSGQADEPGKGFTDITRACGVEAAVNKKYEADPKWWLSGLHLVDLDGDGQLDLFLSSHGGGGSVAMLNDGKGSFRPADGTWPSTEIHLAYDADEDGKVDLTMTYQDGGGKWWLNRSKPGALSFEDTKAGIGTNQARRQCMIDINRDGKVDWLRGTPQGIVFELGDGKGRFGPGGRPAIPIDAGRCETLCLPIDLDGDGFIDFLVEWGHYQNSKGASRIYRNDGKMSFADVTRDSGLSGENMSIKGAGDANADGFPDLLVLENMKPELYLNDGKGKFTKKEGAFAGLEQATKPSMSSWGVAVVVDIDNDGIPDILWNGKHFLWVLKGQPDGTFKYLNKAWGIKDTSASSVDDGLCFGDIDDDGMLDLVGYTAISNQRRFAVYRNDLPKQNYVRVRAVGLSGNRGAAGAKIRLTDPATGKLLATEQVCIWDSQVSASYYALAQTERHFGIGKRATVDVTIEFYPSGKKVEQKGVKANTTVVVNEKLISSEHSRSLP